MSERILYVKRTVIHTLEVKYPDSYPGMTLQEAIAAEYDITEQDAIDQLAMASDNGIGEIEVSTTVTLEDISGLQGELLEQVIADAREA